MADNGSNGNHRTYSMREFNRDAANGALQGNRINGNGNGRLDGDLEAGAPDSPRQFQAGSTPGQLNAIANGVRQENRVHVDVNGGSDEYLEAGARYSISQDHAGKTPRQLNANQYQDPLRPVSAGAAGVLVVEDALSSDASNGAATANRGASRAENMRAAFRQWRGVATDEKKNSLSEQAFRIELFESEGEGKVKSEAVGLATNAVDQSAGRNKTDGSQTDETSKVEFKAKRVAITNYNPLGSGPQTGAGLADYALSMSPPSSPGANGGGQSPDTVVAVNSTSASEISSPGSSHGTPPGQ